MVQTVWNALAQRRRVEPSSGGGYGKGEVWLEGNRVLIREPRFKKKKKKVLGGAASDVILGESEGRKRVEPERSDLRSGSRRG